MHDLILLTVREVAARLRVSLASVYDLIKKGKLAAHRVGNHGGAIRVSEQSLLDYLGRSVHVTASSLESPPPRVQNLKHIRLRP
jgi:excisionase family DNA binding protein